MGGNNKKTRINNYIKGININKMSTENPQQTQPGPAKPITANFQLQTKIRVIIQQVLNATMRKISQFHQKVQNFEQFFFSYKQKVSDVEERSNSNQKSISRLTQLINSNRSNAQANDIRLQEMIERAAIEMNEKTNQLEAINKKITLLTRQSETLNNDLSKTKSKFLEYSQQMTNMKEQVSWKITKYVQETAQANTQIKLLNEEIKKEYHHVQLALESNKKKYDQIVQSKDIQESFNQRMQENAEKMSAQLLDRKEEIKQLNKKLEDMDTALYTKIKVVESKLERRIEELVESNKKISESVKKVDKFGNLLDQVREDVEKMRIKLMKKFEQSDQLHKNRLQKEILQMNKGILQFQKKMDKSVKSLTDSQEKTVDFFNQKMDYLKVQLQTEISSKASRMLEEKSKSANGAANSAIIQLQDRMSKVALDTTKSVNKLETLIKQTKTEVKNQMDDLKSNVETRISTTIKNIEESTESGISPQLMNKINQKIQKISDSCEYQIFNMNKELAEQNLKVLAVEKMKQETEKKFYELTQQNRKNFEQVENHVTGKVEKVMFLVTKMRGDAIIRNQFTDKQIKQLRKLQMGSNNQLGMINKLIPAFGECINLIMCLIFDAEYQHSKIIQDNLPIINKDILKFQNVLEGVLYQYSDKKKAGCIFYRHKQHKKIDIVRATFMAYIQTWEQLFTDDSKIKERQDFIPRGFYKKFVEKGIGKRSQGNSPRKDASQPLHNSIPNQKIGRQFNSSKQLKDLDISDDSKNYIGSGSIDSSENINNRSSFHIRKKKNAMIKQKEDMIAIVQEQVRE